MNCVRVFITGLNIMINWLNSNSAAVTAIATVVLSGLTGIYIWITNKIAKAASEQILIENKPIVYIVNTKITRRYEGPNNLQMKIFFNHINNGHLPAKIINCTFQFNNETKEIFPKDLTLYPKKENINIIIPITKYITEIDKNMKFDYEYAINYTYELPLNKVHNGTYLEKANVVKISDDQYHIHLLKVI